MLFSIVIPTYDRPKQLKKCLGSIADLDFSKNNFEVIVVDDGSPKPIAHLFEGFKQQLKIVFIRQKKAGPATARNTGAANASGQYLVFTDDDCLIKSDYLNKLKSAFKQKPNAVFAGRTINFYKDNIYSQASQLLTDYLHKAFESVDGQKGFLTSNNFSLPRTVFLKVGGFNPLFVRAAAEDRELGYRLEHAGFSVLYEPSLQLLHAHKMNFFQFSKQHFNYGCGAFLFHIAKKEYNNKMRRIHPIKFYSAMFGYPFKSNAFWSSVKITAVLFISQAATLLGYIREKLLVSK